MKDIKDMKRILLKLSGEALAGDKKTGFDEATCMDVARQVKVLADRGLQISIVIGGGNFWRGRTSENMERTKADQIGMLATVMNCIYVADAFRTAGLETEVFTPFVCGSFTELFSKDKAVEAMEDGKIAFFAGGTGHPYFSTDTATALRAVEIEADAILLAKSIDGVYDSDPAVNPDAKKYDTISLDEVLDQKLAVVDLTATIMCLENKMPLAVFGLNEPDSIANLLKGKFNGTYVTVRKMLKKFEDKMQKSYENMTSEFMAIRAGRANPHVLDKVTVDYYGVPTPIQQVGNVSVPEARTILIQPWEPNLLGEIEKAIMMSDIGITPNNDGSAIRLNFPELTEERRKDLAKDIKKRGETTKVAVRNIRRDANDELKKMNKANELNDDQLKDQESEVQKLTDVYIKKIDDAVEAKSKEIMTV